MLGTVIEKDKSSLTSTMTKHSLNPLFVTLLSGLSLCDKS